MQLITRNPWELMNGLSRDVDRWFFGTATDREGWAPAIDIAETDGHYVFTADLPGVKRDDVEITVDDRILTIQGQRQTETETQGLRRVERAQGRFYRRFRLPEQANQEGIEAHYAEGVLTVRVPKQVRAEARKIEVKSS
jgi:HSP20 family protein